MGLVSECCDVTIVNVRCSATGCRRLLRSIDAWPEDGSPLWSDVNAGLWIERCAKHRELRQHEVITEADERRSTKGLPPLDRARLMIFVSWPDLRPTYLDATHRGRKLDVLRP